MHVGTVAVPEGAVQVLHELSVEQLSMVAVAPVPLIYYPEAALEQLATVLSVTHSSHPVAQAEAVVPVAFKKNPGLGIAHLTAVAEVYTLQFVMGVTPVVLIAAHAAPPVECWS